MTKNLEALGDTLRRRRAHRTALAKAHSAAVADQAAVEAECHAFERGRRERLSDAVSGAVARHLGQMVPDSPRPVDDRDASAATVLDGRLELTTATVARLQLELDQADAGIATAIADIEREIARCIEVEQRSALRAAIVARDAYRRAIQTLQEWTPDGRHVRVGDQRPIPPDINAVLDEASRLTDDLKVSSATLRGLEPQRDRGSERMAELRAAFVGDGTPESTT